MQHAYPLDDLLEGPPEPTAEEVRAQVADWLRRLDDLYAAIEAWAEAHGWQVEVGEPEMIEDERLERFAIGPIQQPTRVLYAPTGQRVSIRPKSPWVIGANGRIDIFAPGRVYVLIDVAEAMAPPRWRCHRLGRGPVEPFTAEKLASMI
jgi:hypothetical protein